MRDDECRQVSIITGIDYLAQGAKTLATLGLDGLTAEELLDAL